MTSCLAFTLCTGVNRAGAVGRVRANWVHRLPYARYFYCTGTIMVITRFSYGAERLIILQHIMTKSLEKKSGKVEIVQNIDAELNSGNTKSRELSKTQLRHDCEYIL